MSRPNEASPPAAADLASFLSAALELCRADEENLEALWPSAPASQLPVVAVTPQEVPRLAEMLRRVGLDPAAVSDAYPDLLRRSQGTCLGCSETDRCDRELAAGTANTSYVEFCPNADRIHALLASIAATDETGCKGE